MHVAINATALGPHRSGVGSFMLEILRHLPADPDRDQVTVFCDPRFAETDLLQRPGFTLVPSTLPTGRLYTRLVWENTLLPRLLRRLRPDVFHGMAFSLPLLPLRVPSVVTIYDLVHRVLPGRQPWYFRVYLDRMVSLSSRRARHIIAISQTTKRDLVDHYGIPAGRIAVTYGGVEGSFSPSRDEQAWKEVRRRHRLPGRFALAVGDLEPRKNLLAAIRACALLRQHGVELPLVLAGKTTAPAHTAELRAEARRLGLTDQVLFIGRVDASELPTLYRAAEVFLFPSLYEGFGLPAVEAMASATPVVASRAGALAEVVGTAGILVSPHAPAEMAQAVQRLLTDLRLRDAKVRQGLERAQAFSWEEAGRRTLEVYRKVLHTATGSDVPATDPQ